MLLYIRKNEHSRCDLGIDLYTAKDFVELHERLNKDLTVSQAWESSVEVLRNFSQCSYGRWEGGGINVFARFR